MNQHSQTTSDMTVSKSAEVEQQPPGQALSPPDIAAAPRATSAVPDKAEPSPAETGSAETSAAETGLSEMDGGARLRQVPIPPASEPLQYRAIGLIRGVYEPSEEQFTRGNIITDDKTPIDAVLLGRVMSLVKKHVDLAEPHLWVVYPRTRPNNTDLHAQIVGVWEPENLSQDDDDDSIPGGDRAETEDLRDQISGEAPTAAAETEAEPESPASSAEAVTSGSDSLAGIESTEASPDAGAEASPDAGAEADTQLSNEATEAGAEADPQPSPDPGAIATSLVSPKKPTPSPPAVPEHPSGVDNLQDGYFSIRGEVVRQSRGGEDLTIKICQAPRKGDKRSRAFKLLLRGTVNRRAVGSFWDMHVQRQGNDLVIQEAIFIKDMPPTKRRGRGGPPRRGRSGPPKRRQDRPAPAVQRQGSSAPSRPVPKPIIKRQSHPSTPTEQAAGE